MTTLGKYQLGPVLGQGGMGAVYRSFHPQLNRTVAIKVLTPHAAADPEAVQRFIREAQVVAGLSHPNIINIFDVDVDANGRPFLVMELLEQGSLAARLRQGPLALADALPLMAALADALHYAHNQGLVHRDLKPANVLLRADGSPVLADFGLARATLPDPAARITATGVLLGTLAYMAPEQLRGQMLDARTDIYALGVMCYETLTGTLPFEGDSGEMIVGHLQHQPRAPRVLNPGIPAEIEQLILRMMEKDPARRPQSAAEIAHALRNWSERGAATGPTIAMTAATQQVVVGPQPINPRAGGWFGATLFAAVTAGLLLLAMALFGMFALVPGTRDDLPAMTGQAATALSDTRPTAVSGDSGAQVDPDITPLALERVDGSLFSDAKPAGAGQEQFSVGGVTYRNRDDAIWFFGEVRNDGDQTRASIELRVFLLDAAGAELLSHTSYADLDYLAPNEVAPFTVLFTDDDGPLPEFASYKIEVRSRAPSIEVKSTVREIMVSGEPVVGRRAFGSSIYVSGAVRNNAERPAQFVSVIVVLYDNEDNVVGVGSGYADLPDDDRLARGAVAPFELDWSILTGEPARYYLIAEGKNYD